MFFDFSPIFIFKVGDEEMKSKKLLREQNYSWVGYAYFAVGLFSFVLLQGLPMFWLRFAFLGLAGLAAWYFLEKTPSQRLLISENQLVWACRFNNQKDEGAIDVDNIRAICLHRPVTSSARDAFTPVVVLTTPDGKAVCLPESLGLGRAQSDSLNDIVTAPRELNPRIRMRIEHYAPDYPALAA